MEAWSDQHWSNKGCRWSISFNRPPCWKIDFTDITCLTSVDHNLWGSDLNWCSTCVLSKRGHFDQQSGCADIQNFQIINQLVFHSILSLNWMVTLRAYEYFSNSFLIFRKFSCAQSDMRLEQGYGKLHPRRHSIGIKHDSVLSGAGYIAQRAILYWLYSDHSHILKSPVHVKKLLICS